jgi:ribose/xylose/arabinose/galactoside ABC-type transport system permease subunit
MMAEAAPAPHASFGNLLHRIFLSEYLVLWLSVAYVAAVGPFTPGFFTAGNFINILITLLPLFIVALGQTVVLISGGIDLSVTSIMGLTSLTGAIVMNSDDGWLAGHPLAVPAGVCLMLTLGSFIGLVNGAAITRFRMPPFIVTLTAMMFLLGFARWLTKSKAISNLPSSFNALGGNVWSSLAITFALAGFAQLMLSRSVFGRWLYATGHNMKASHVSGVPINGVILSAYILSGFCAALSSLLYTGLGETGSAELGQRILLDIIGATVIGGTSLFGGKGKIVWTLFGVLFLKLIDNSLNLLSLSIFSITMVKGAVILFAALMDALRNRFVVRGS